MELPNSIPLDPAMLRNLTTVREANRTAMVQESRGIKNIARKIEEVPPTRYLFENPAFKKVLTKKDSSESFTTTETEMDFSSSIDENETIRTSKVVTTISKSSNKKEELTAAFQKAKQELATAEKEWRNAAEEQEWMEEQKKNASNKKKTSLPFTFFSSSQNKEKPNKVEERYQQKLLAHQQAIASLKEAQQALVEWEAQETAAQLQQAQQNFKKAPTPEKRTVALREEAKAYFRSKRAQEKLKEFNSYSEKQ